MEKQKEEEEKGGWLERGREEEETGIRVGIEEEDVKQQEEGKRPMSRVERQLREVDEGRGRGGGGVVEREKRDVEEGRGGTGERGKNGSSIMGCRMSTEAWQVVG